MNKRYGLPVAVVIMVIAVLFSGPALAAEIYITCDAVQGFQFDPSQTTPVGHLTYLKIGDTEFVSDLAVVNPEDLAGDHLSVAGVMEDIYWEGGYAAPIHFTARLSTANKNTVAVLLHTAMSNTRVQVRFDVYDYDVTDGKYYNAFHTNTVTVAGYIESSGGDLQINVDMEEAMDVVSPANFSFFLNVASDDIASHELHLAVSVSDKLVKQWGITSSPAPDISTSITTMDFGTVEAGQTPSRTITVYNDGTGDLNIGVVGLSDPLEAPYLITANTCSGQSLSSSGTCAVTVTFHEPVVSAAVVLPTAGGLGVLACGLVFAGGPSRRSQLLIVLAVMAISAMALLSCGGGNPQDTPNMVEYTGSFDIPSNDPDSSTVTVDVVGWR